MRQLPTVRAVYTDEENRELSRQPPPPGVASAFGCDYRYLHYALDENCDASSYRVHPFHTFYVNRPDKVLEFSPTQQFDKIEQLVPGRLATRPSPLVVINSAGNLEEGFSLMWHLACSAANYRCKTRDQSILFSYLADAWLQTPDDGWLLKPKQILAWGPIVDDSREFSYEKANSFLLNFHFMPRILLLAVTDIDATLRRLNLDPERLEFLFNLQTSRAVSEVRKQQKKKSKLPKEPKAPKVIAPKSTTATV